MAHAHVADFVRQHARELRLLDLAEFSLLADTTGSRVGNGAMPAKEELTPRNILLFW